jgi:4-amino-4-deoxy-L-arabinose transferase-like glycosyltransferase
MDGEGAPTRTRVAASNDNPAQPADSTALSHRLDKTKLPLLITIGAGLVVYALFYNRGIWLAVVGYSVSPAQRVLGGEVPYRDFLFNYTPGILWLNAAVMRVFGVSLLPIHVVLFVFKVAALIALYLLGKRLMPAALALMPVGLTLCWLGHRFIFNVHPTQYSMLFVLAATIAALRYDETEDIKWLIASGVLVGLVFVFKYNVGLILLGTGSAAIVGREVVPGFGRPAVSRTGTIARVLWYWLGFGLIAGGMCCYLAFNGALAPMLDHFLHHAADYSEERAVGLPSLMSLLPAATGLLTAAIGLRIVRMQAPRLLPAAICTFAVIGGALILIPGRAGILKDAATGAVAYLPPMTFLYAAGWIVFRLRRRTRDHDPAGAEPANGAGAVDSVNEVDRERRLMIVACFALGAYQEVYPRADDYHLVRVLPPVFVCLTYLLFCVLTWDRQQRRTSRSAAAGASTAASAQQSMAGFAALVLLLLALTGIKDTWVPQFDGWFMWDAGLDRVDLRIMGPRLADRTPVGVARTRGIMTSEYEAGMIEELTGLIQANSSPGDSIFSFARRGAGFYFFADRRNPTKLLWWDSVGIKPADRAAVLDMIETGTPRLVLVQMALDDRQVRDRINAKYQKVGVVEDIEVFGAR